VGPAGDECWVQVCYLKRQLARECAAQTGLVQWMLSPPRPRLYGLVGGELIEEVWRERQHARDEAATQLEAVGAGG